MRAPLRRPPRRLRGRPRPHPGGAVRLRPPSLRTRVTALAALGLLLGLALAGALLVRSLRGGLLTDLDAAARVRAADAADDVAAGDLGGAVSPTSAGSQVQVLSSSGRVRARSPLLDGQPALVAPPYRRSRVVGHLAVAGRTYRVLIVPQPAGALAVASDLAPVQESTRRLLQRLVVLGPVLLGAVAAMVWLLTGYALSSIEAVRGQALGLLARRPGSQAPALHVPTAQDEVRHLVQTFNDLLARLHQAVASQRRLVADAAHELRTPVAALSLRLEVTQQEDDLDHWRAAAPVLLDDVHHLADVVDDLLTLARLDDGQPPRRSAVDLDDVVLAALARLRPTAPGIRVDLAALAPVEVLGDRGLLDRAVGNLLANALRFADSTVSIELAEQADGALLRVIDDGPGIPTQERDRVFDRFQRLDRSRDRATGGTGLGLAIARSAALAHGGSVHLEDGTGDGRDARGTAAVLRLPRVSASSAGGDR